MIMIKKNTNMRPNLRSDCKELDFEEIPYLVYYILPMLVLYQIRYLWMNNWVCYRKYSWIYVKSILANVATTIVQNIQITASNRAPLTGDYSLGQIFTMQAGVLIWQHTYTK